MSGEPNITVFGNLTADPEMRFLPNGAGVASFTVASTPRYQDRQSGEWKDGETLFLRCSVWRQQGENVVDSLTRGMRVIVNGRLKQRSYETKEGEKRTVFELDVDEIGPSLRNATAKITKAIRVARPTVEDPWPPACRPPPEPRTGCLRYLPAQEREYSVYPRRRRGRAPSKRNTPRCQAQLPQGQPP